MEFITDKVRNHGSDIVVTSKDGTPETLAQLFGKLKIDINAFNLNVLDTRVRSFMVSWRPQADGHQADNTFERFDNFNAKYSPMGVSQLRDVFLKSENGVLRGRY